MNAASANQDNGLHSEFLHIIRDLSFCLKDRKQSGNTVLSLSDESMKILENWSAEKKTGAGFQYQGPQDARIFIIDSGATFFSGDAGNLLVKILAAMTLKPDDVFICNTPNSRLVHTKIKEVSPKVIITLGEAAGQSLLNVRQPLEKFRGKIYEYAGIKVMPTFHPSLLLKDPAFKRQVWDDMKKVMALAGLGR